MHTRRLDDRVLNFGHRGWLWFNAYLLYDTETDSIWHHQNGRALSGPLRGRVLPRLPSSLMTFEAWTSEHPDTLVLPKPADRPDTDRDPYAARTAGLSLGVAVEFADAHRIYPFHAFGQDRLVQDEVSGTPLVLAVHGASGGGFAYDRRVDGVALDFLAEDDPKRGPVLRETGGARAWRMRTGRPVAGSGAERPLRRVLASLWEVTAWSLQHPGGSVFGR